MPVLEGRLLECIPPYANEPLPFNLKVLLFILNKELDCGMITREIDLLVCLLLTSGRVAASGSALG